MTISKDYRVSLAAISAAAFLFAAPMLAGAQGVTPRCERYRRPR
jgi:hypothetical protein